MRGKNEEPQGTSNVTFRVPDFFGEDGIEYTDIEVIVEMDSDIRSITKIAQTLERAVDFAGCVLEGQRRRQDVRVSLSDGVGPTADTAQRSARWSGQDRRDMKFEDGKAFHAFRRFRTAHLRKNRMPWDLQKLWLGHANKDVTDRYAEQLKEDVEGRKQEAERAGLGFKLPAIESSVGLLGLPTHQKSTLKKIA